MRLRFRITEDTVWSAAAEFPIVGRGEAAESRIEFELPETALPTTSSTNLSGGQDPGHYWRVRVHIDVAGVDLLRSYLVPVVALPAGKITG